MKYGLTWDQEKNPETIVTQTDAGVPFIEEIKELTVKGQDTQHILIDSDNYPALKILNQTHRNAIDIICIDPPYNTGNEFIYNDKRIDNEDDYRHSKWLNFMDKRMRLAYSLLKEDGVAYCFIGDDELANLTLMMDQIFGTKNRVSIIARVCKSGSGFAKHLTPSCDYILMYAKDINKIESLGLNVGERSETRSLVGRAMERPNQRFWIQCPDGSFIIPKGITFPEIGHLNGIRSTNNDNVWGYTKDRFKEEFENGNVKITKRNTPHPACVNENQENAYWDVTRTKDLSNIKKIPNFIHGSEFINTQGTKELKELFGGEKVFDYPKPTALIEYLINIINKGKNITVLDFFAGSGTMAHAVMNMNEKDLGSRQSISVALNDPDDEIDICTEVTYKRLKIVLNNIRNKYNGQLDLTNAGNPTLKYFKTQILDYQSETQSILIEKNNKETLCQ